MKTSDLHLGPRYQLLLHKRRTLNDSLIYNLQEWCMCGVLTLTHSTDYAINRTQTISKVFHIHKDLYSQMLNLHMLKTVSM